MFAKREPESSAATPVLTNDAAVLLHSPAAIKISKSLVNLSIRIPLFKTIATGRRPRDFSEALR